MIETILVPVDISAPESATKSLALAGPIAGAHNSNIILLNVVEPIPGIVDTQLPPHFRENVRAEALDTLKQIARDNGLSESTETSIREGRSSSEILNHARECSADPIVLASHDPGFADFLIGSVAARVVQHAHCSVLVAR